MSWYENVCDDNNLDEEFHSDAVGFCQVNDRYGSGRATRRSTIMRGIIAGVLCVLPVEEAGSNPVLLLLLLFKVT